MKLEYDGIVVEIPPMPEADMKKLLDLLVASDNASFEAGKAFALDIVQERMKQEQIEYAYCEVWHGLEKGIRLVNKVKSSILLKGRTRKQYLNSLGERNAAEYICNASRDNQYKMMKAMGDPKEMEEWLKTLVDDKGQEVI